MKSAAFQELDNNLRERDDATRDGRAERLAELMILGEPESGRMLSADATDSLWDAQWSYINGLFVAAILVSQACVEKLLSAHLHTMGREPERSYAGLLRGARDDGMLPEYIFEIFDRLRQARNPYAHHRDVNHADYPFNRAASTGTPPDVLLQQDARAAVQALIRLVNAFPFGLGPTVAIFAENDLLPPVHPDQMSLPVAAT